MYNKNIGANHYRLIKDGEEGEPGSKGQPPFAFWSWVLTGQKKLVQEKAA
jgi:hypothetical protein